MEAHGLAGLPSCGLPHPEDFDIPAAQGSAHGTSRVPAGMMTGHVPVFG